MQWVCGRRGEEEATRAVACKALQLCVLVAHCAAVLLTAAQLLVVQLGCAAQLGYTAARQAGRQAGRLKLCCALLFISSWAVR